MTDSLSCEVVKYARLVHGTLSVQYAVHDDDALIENVSHYGVWKYIYIYIYIYIYLLVS